jgi:hypothetical protein
LTVHDQATYSKSAGFCRFDFLRLLPQEGTGSEYAVTDVMKK